jgi:dienelactone hydrolase
MTVSHRVVGRASLIGPLAGLFALCLAGRTASAQGTFTFMSGGDTFSIERFPAAPDAKKRPVVVLVHGTDGLAHFGGQLRGFARDLAGLGYLAVLPNYFGTKDDAEKNGFPDDQLRRLTDAVVWAVGQADADPGRTALVGYSLGAALSLMYAETNPSKVKAVVDHYGPTDAKDPRMSTTLSPAWDIVGGSDKLPPTLILHNRKDQIVPIRHSEDLAAAPRKAGVDRQFIPFDDGDPDVGFHPFLPNSPADTQAKAKAVEWLRKHL